MTAGILVMKKQINFPIDQKSQWRKCKIIKIPGNDTTQNMPATKAIFLSEFSQRRFC